MKKALHYWALPPAMDLFKKLHFAAECGFDGVEPVVLATGMIRPDSTVQELRAVRQEAQSAGVCIHSLTSPLNFASSFTSNDPAIRQKARDNVRAQLRVAGELGADALLVLPGFVALDFEVNAMCAAKRDEKAYSPTQERIRYDDAWNRLLESLAELAPHAEASGVTICVENIWNHFLLSPLEMCTLIDTINSPYIQSYFDIGNVMEFGYPDQWIRILGQRIRRVHIKDYRKESHHISGFTDIGKGDVDFSAVMAALKDIRYDGWVTAELNADPNDPEQVARDTIRAMRELMD